jgi:hypothetical protein
MIDNEQDKQTLKEKKMTFPIQEQQNFSLSSSVVTPLVCSPVCLHLLGRLEPYWDVEKLLMGWGFSVLEFCFFVLLFFFAKCGSSRKVFCLSAEGLPSMFGAGGWWAGRWG